MSLSRTCLYTSLMIIARHQCTRNLCKRWFSCVTHSVSEPTHNALYTAATTGLFGGKGALKNCMMGRRYSVTPSHNWPEDYSKDRLDGKPNSQHDIRRSILGDKDLYLSCNEWYEVKKKYDDTPKAFHTIIMKDIFHLEYHEMGMSLFDWLTAENIPVRDVDVIQFLQLCIKNNELDHVFRWYASWKKNQYKVTYPMHVLLINAYCQTEMWRESLILLRQMGDIDPSGGTVSVPIHFGKRSRHYEWIVCAACRQDDWIVIEDILNRIRESGAQMADDTVMEVMRSSMRRGNVIPDEKKFHQLCDNLLLDLLAKHQKNRTYPSLALVKEMQAWLKSKDEAWQTRLTATHPQGYCEACKEKLKPLEISQQQFDNLRDRIMEKVVKGSDIFRKTTPEELDAFIQFINEGAPYDIIIDGLNIAYNTKHTYKQAQRLYECVVHLAEKCGYKCLVLGRQHMVRNTPQWNNQYMQGVRDLADCFFTENLSKDDPFMLYATLHSGPNTRFVTKDILRDHKALLDDDMDSIFFRWQKSRQLIPKMKERKMVFQTIYNSDAVVQSTEDSWHIPYDDGTPRFSYERPMKWLCARKSTSTKP